MGGPEGMKCYRCGGAMVYEKFYGHDDRYWGWRCIICGEIVDEVILENRRWVGTGLVPIDGKSKADTAQ
jgi:hypothetical protein